jgi:hypothetical protein
MGEELMTKMSLRQNLQKNKMTLKNIGISPNLLLKDVENTAPFIFSGEIESTGKDREFLSKLIFYKKNLKALKTINLFEYFSICMSAHWATAGTFVPTNVDNQIRESLWRHGEVGAHLEKMGRLTIESWSWNYSDVTNRKTSHPRSGELLSTHEGTWLSVAIGAYVALKKNKRTQLAEEMAVKILEEIEKEEKILTELRESRDHINFLKTCALMAHNFGDLDRVIDQWQVPDDDAFRKRIYKLGHQLNDHFSPILSYAGNVNKAFLSVENHRHMSMRQPRCLRRSSRFLISLGPFMDEWGKTLGESQLLSLEEKGEIIIALFDGFKRQDHAFGYTRAFKGLVESLPDQLDTLVAHIPFDLMREIKKSQFYELSKKSSEEFSMDFKKKLEDFVCPLTKLNF